MQRHPTAHSKGRPNGGRRASADARRDGRGPLPKNHETLPRYGAIDLGTNNCRLLVAIPDDTSFRVIDSYSRIVRLGEGLAGTGGLCEDAMCRTIEALKVCASVMERQNVSRYRAVATEACRRGGNAPAFVDRVRAETGIELETVSCEGEVNLTFAGCCGLLDSDKRHGLVLDIGGGSSELMWIDQSSGTPTVTTYHSIPEGVVTLSERYGGDCVGPDGYERIIADITARLDDFPAASDADEATRAGALTMLGTSGTVTTLGAMHLGLRRYERNRVDGMVIDFESIARLSRRLAEQDCATRSRNPCIGTERADLVVMGCAILEAVCRRWNVGRMRVADRGIREGLLYGMMRDDGHVSPANGSSPTHLTATA